MLGREGLANGSGSDNFHDVEEEEDEEADIAATLPSAVDALGGWEGGRGGRHCLQSWIIKRIDSSSVLAPQSQPLNEISSSLIG